MDPHELLECLHGRDLVVNQLIEMLCERGFLSRDDVAREFTALAAKVETENAGYYMPKSRRFDVSALRFVAASFTRPYSLFEPVSDLPDPSNDR